MKRFTITIVILTFFVALPEAIAQKYTKSKRYTSIGGGLSALNYFGDLTPSSAFTSADVRFTRPNISLHITRRYTPRFSAKASIAWGRLQGDDFKSANASDKNGRYRFIRNTHFRNDVKELAVVGMLDLFENRNTFLRRLDFVPYGFAGIAVFHHNPKALTPEDLGGNWVALQPLGTEGQFANGPGSERYPSPYKRIQLSIPAGVGFRYKISPRIDLAFEIGYRFTFFDYLDDVSGNYPDMGDLSSDLARRMSDRTLESISARTGELRDPTLNRVLEDTGLNVRTFTGSDGNLYNTVNGFAVSTTTRDGQRGKPSENDWYMVTGFHINYILIKGVRCPKFR